MNMATWLPFLIAFLAWERNLWGPCHSIVSPKNFRLASSMVLNLSFLEWMYPIMLQYISKICLCTGCLLSSSNCVRTLKRSFNSEEIEGGISMSSCCPGRLPWHVFLWWGHIVKCGGEECSISLFNICNLTLQLDMVANWGPKLSLQWYISLSHFQPHCAADMQFLFLCPKSKCKQLELIDLKLPKLLYCNTSATLGQEMLCK